MPTHVIVLATPHPHKAEDAARYAQAVQPLLATAGAKPLFRGPVTVTVAGGDTPSTGMVLEFPDHEAATDFFAQDAYQALVAIRDEAFARMEIHIVG
jgi:uncharacterized protein (DUF1330 family)